MKSVHCASVRHKSAAAYSRRRGIAQFQAGFQLFELLIAMAVVSVLAVIAIPSYSNYRDRVDNATAAGDIDSIVQRAICNKIKLLISCQAFFRFSYERNRAFSIQGHSKLRTGSLRSQLE